MCACVKNILTPGRLYIRVQIAFIEATITTLEIRNPPKLNAWVIYKTLK